MAKKTTTPPKPKDFTEVLNAGADTRDHVSMVRRLVKMALVGDLKAMDTLLKLAGPRGLARSVKYRSLEIGDACPHCQKVVISHPGQIAYCVQEEDDGRV